MKKIGQIIEFDGRFGLMTEEKEEFNFHISDFSNSNSTASIGKGDIVEFRVEHRPYNIKRAKNIKVLQKIHITNNQKMDT